MEHVWGQQDTKEFLEHVVQLVLKQLTIPEAAGRLPG